MLCLTKINGQDFYTFEQFSLLLTCTRIYLFEYLSMTDEISVRPKTIIVVYEQPKVTIVRKYTRNFIRHVNPDEYRQRYEHVLLDTSTLLEITQRLNIQQSMIMPPKYTK